MKHILIVISVVFLFFIGCDQKREEPEQNNTPNQSSSLTPQELTEQGVFLSYNLEKGDDFTYKFTSISEDKQVIKADTQMVQEIKETRTYLVNFKVQDREDSGVIEMQVLISSITLDALGNDQKISYQSGMPMDSIDQQRFGEYEVMVNTPFAIRVTPYGEVLEIFRADRITRKMIKQSGLQDSLTVQERQMYYLDVVENVLRPIVTQIFKNLPKTVVSVDSGWAVKQPPANMQLFSMVNTHTFKLKEFKAVNGENLAVIEAGLIHNSQVNKEEAKKNNLTVQPPSFEGSGTLEFNLSRGLYQNTKTNTEFTLEFSSTMQGPRGYVKVVKTQITKNTNMLELQ